MNRPTIAFAIGLTLALMLGACRQMQHPTAVSTQLTAGTQVDAILLCDLTSGGDQEGDPVPMVVSEDVKDSAGHILIGKGTPFKGTITWSRTEGSLGSVLNQPARLKFKFENVKAVDGGLVSLSADASAAEDYELNRDNTGHGDASQAITDLANNKDDQQTVDALRKLFQDGDEKDLQSPEAREKLQQIAQSLGLPATSEVAKENHVDQLSALVKQLRQGASIAAVASGGATTLVDSAIELAGVVGQVGSRLERMVGGRNIHAFVGTPVRAYVSKTVIVQVPPESSEG